MITVVFDKQDYQDRKRALKMLVQKELHRKCELKSVVDAVNDNTSTLGDFKYDAGAKGSDDYTYDANGNMTSDANKKISSITYNHLNLPCRLR